MRSTRRLAATIGAARRRFTVLHPWLLAPTLCGAVALGILAVVTAPGSARAEPFVPAEDSQVVERLPTSGDAMKRELRRLRDELATNPRDLDLALRLARHDIEIGRAESDPRYYGYAQAALAAWWDQARPPVEVLILRATLRQNRHDFNSALRDLSMALAADPRNARAWLTRAVILQVQGRHEAARVSCSRLALLAIPLVTATCLADVGGVSGGAKQGYEMLSRVLAGSAKVDPTIRLWALTVLGEIAARSDHSDAAMRHFRAALALDTRDAYLLGAYADFLLDQGRAAEARGLLASETRADPLLLRLALAERALGASELRDHIAALSARFEANRMRGDAVHRREEARFTLHLLDRPADALRLALENWRVQREPWDARLVLQAALAAGDPSAAADVIDWVQRTHIEDRQIATLIDRLNRANR